MSGLRPSHVKLPAVQISPEELAGVSLTDDSVRRLRGLQARLSAGEVKVEELSEAGVEDLYASTSSALPVVTQPLPEVALTEADYLRLQDFHERITAQGIPATRISSASRSSPLPRSIQAPANRLALTAASTAGGLPNRHLPARPSVSSMSYPIRTLLSAATSSAAYASTASSPATATAHVPAVYLNTAGSPVRAPSALQQLPFPHTSQPQTAGPPAIKPASSKKSNSIPTPKAGRRSHSTRKESPSKPAPPKITGSKSSPALASMGEAPWAESPTKKPRTDHLNRKRDTHGKFSKT